MADIRVEPIRGIRAAMAKHLLDAATTIPHFTLGDEIEMSALLALKRELQLEAEHHGIRLTLMAFFIKALALAVREYPVMNSRVNAECTELHYLPECNVGLAVDSPGGLLVPNVKGVGSLSLMTVAREVQRLTLNGREGRLSPDDLAGGTITITNIGALGGTYAVPLINKPEVAIVALGRIQRLPRFDEANEVVENRIMKVSWSGDHRVIDGATLARFNNLWRSYLEKPSTLLLELS
jgi:2-oxoisovalerate dehydrogenase E2 component (dihydrolipoyl transacylase)